MSSALLIPSTPPQLSDSSASPTKPHVCHGSCHLTELTFLSLTGPVPAPLPQGLGSGGSAWKGLLLDGPISGFLYPGPNLSAVSLIPDPAIQNQPLLHHSGSFLPSIYSDLIIILCSVLRGRVSCHIAQAGPITCNVRLPGYWNYRCASSHPACLLA